MISLGSVKGLVKGLAQGSLHIAEYYPAEQTAAADALQPTLRSGFRARLSGSVRCQQARSSEPDIS